MSFEAALNLTLSGKRGINLSLSQLRTARNQILKNIRAHCNQLYKQGSLSREACRIAAAIAAAEIADVFEERFGVRL